MVANTKHFLALGKVVWEPEYMRNCHRMRLIWEKKKNSNISGASINTGHHE